MPPLIFFYLKSCSCESGTCLIILTHSSLYSSIDLVDTLRTDFDMAYTGTLKPNRKDLLGDFKSMKGREDGDYFVLYDVTGKKSIHSWLNKKKSGVYSIGNSIL